MKIRVLVRVCSSVTGGRNSVCHLVLVLFLYSLHLFCRKLTFFVRPNQDIGVSCILYVQLYSVCKHYFFSRVSFFFLFERLLTYIAYRDNPSIFFKIKNMDLRNRLKVLHANTHTHADTIEFVQHSLVFGLWNKARFIAFIRLKVEDGEKRFG